MGSINELSLFSGYGGFSLGLRLAGIQTRTVAYVEWAKYPQEILKARIKDGYLDDAPIFSDISSFRGEQFRGMVDLITAGFPCQPHSVAGLQRGADDERNLWPQTLTVIRNVGPRYVLLENVPGLLSASSDGGRPAYGGTVVGELASLGYSVHWQTIGADDVGAPHRRKRWWCIAVADSRCRDARKRANTARRIDTNGEPLARELADSDSNRARERHNSHAERGYPGEIPEGRDSQGTQDEGTHTDISSATGQLDDTQHYGYARPQEPRGIGSRVHPQTGPVQPEQPTGSSVSATGGEDMGDPDRGRFEQRQPEAEPQTWASQPSERNDGELADSSGERGQGRKIHRGHERETPKGRETSTSQPSSQNGQLADCKGERLEGVWDNGHQEGWQEPNGSVDVRSGTIPVWPPSPSDTDAWERVLRERPDLAPALSKEAESQFRGMDNGRSHRVDELKALGNGIVPAVVAEFLRRVLV